jgi:hypothetical protein
VNCVTYPAAFARAAAVEVGVSRSQGDLRRPKSGRAAAAAEVGASGDDGWSRCERQLELDGDGARLDDGGDTSGHDVSRSRLVASSFPSYPSRLAFLFLRVRRRSLFLFEF